MPLRFKMDVLAELKKKGLTSYRIRRDKILSKSTVQKLRTGKGLAWDNLETLCCLLECQPGDLLEYVEEGTEDAEEKVSEGGV